MARGSDPVVWNRARCQFVDLIGWIDDTGDPKRWRFDRHGNEIRHGAQLTVREGQTALFGIISCVVQEKARDIAGPRPMGFRPGGIRAVLLLEGAIVGPPCGVAGWIIGWLLIEPLWQVRPQSAAEPRRGRGGSILTREASTYLAGAAFAPAAAMVAAFMTARTASRLNPVDIVRGAA